MATETKQKYFAFFSKENHDERQGAETIQLRDAVTGGIVEANWIGEEVDGFPGSRLGKTVVRPLNYESYICVGEVGPGKLTVIEISDQMRKWQRFWPKGPLLADPKP